MRVEPQHDFDFLDHPVPAVGGRAMTTDHAGDFEIGEQGVRTRCARGERDDVLQRLAGQTEPVAIAGRGHFRGGAQKPLDRRMRIGSIALRIAGEAHAMAIDRLDDRASVGGQRFAQQHDATRDRIVRGRAVRPQSAADLVVADDASILKKVDEYLHANIGVPVYNHAVAARAGVSTRTLHNLMVNLRGVGLARYVHIRRLWRTYNALSQDTLVKTVAMDNGFTHLGRFALDFRSQFGVLPRDVRLARSYSAPVAGDSPVGETAVGASATGGHRAEPDVGARIGC